MPLILALDQGTTATTALAVDEAREIVARATVPTPLHRPQAGWAENDPSSVLEASGTALSKLLDQIDSSEVAGIGITNQRETTVAWDPATGEALGPAVSWQCRRTEPICQELRGHEGTVAKVRERTGLVIDPYFSATKMRWLLDNEERVGQAEKRGELFFGTIDAFLVHALTGEHATDPSNASRTMLYNLRTASWDPDLAGLLELPMEALPEVRPSSGSFGAVDPGASLGAELDALEGVPVLGVAGDQQASLFGHGCLSPGEAKGTLGTGAFFLVNTGDELLSPTQGVLATAAWDLGEGLTYALEGAAFSCGSVLEWASEAGWLDAPDALDAQAGAVDDADGAVFVPALYGLGAPYWDPDAKAGLNGVSASTTRAHIARAIAEGLSAQNALLLRALADCGQPLDEVRLDGGVSRSDLLTQLMADASSVRVQRAREGEITALGAAGLAGLAAGIWQIEGLAGAKGETFEPRGQAPFVQRYEEMAETIRLL